MASKSPVIAKMVKPFAKLITSELVVTVTLLAPVDASHAIRIVALRLVPLSTNTDVTAMPGPKLTTDVPDAKCAPGLMIVMVKLWPWKPVLGATDAAVVGWTVKAFARVATSLPVVMVAACTPRVAPIGIVMFAISVVALATLILLMVISGPRLT